MIQNLIRLFDDCMSMRRFFLLSLLCVQVLFMVAACAESNNQDQFNAVADVELSSIRNDLELYTDLEAKAGNNTEIKTKLAQSILRHIMIIRTASPKIESLRGEQLETLCLLTKPEMRKILDVAGDPQLAGLAHEYLSLVEPGVRKKIERYQKSMKGTGCYLTPEENR